MYYRKLHTVFFNLQPPPKQVSLGQKLPRKTVPALECMPSIVPPILPDGGVKAHNLLHKVAQQLGLSNHFGQKSVNSVSQHGQKSGDEGSRCIDVNRGQGQV